MLSPPSRDGIEVSLKIAFQIFQLTYAQAYVRRVGGQRFSELTTLYL
jgi:hypothetical protein